MKKILSILIVVLFLYGCPYKRDYYSSAYQPILMERSALENSISFVDGKPLRNTGKIYYKDNYIYISEKYEGVHIINNEDPQNPQNVGFITAPGCIDMAIKGNTLFIDNAIDLVAIDLINKKLVSRTRSVFPELTPPDKKTLDSKYQTQNRPQNTIIVGWRKN